MGAFLELSDTSEPTFLEAFFPNQALARTYESSIYLKKQQDDWAFTFLFSHDLNSTTVQTATQEAPGYRVDREPEVGYYRVGTPLWDNRLTWFSDNTASRMQLRFGPNTPAASGFTDAQSLLNFGFPAKETFHQFFTSLGFPSNYVSRVDSRQEIDAPLKLGIIDATPYVIGRATFYDQDVSLDPDDPAHNRAWGAVGTRLHTEFTRAYDDLDIPVLGIHRLRHIIEPYADISVSVSSVNPDSLVPFEPDVESITQGTVAQMGVRNTFQTQPRRARPVRSVDWLVIDTDVVPRSRDGPTAQDLPASSTTAPSTPAAATTSTATWRGCSPIPSRPSAK